MSACPPGRCPSSEEREAGREAGSKSATERAHGIFKALIESYEQPPIDPGIEEAMQAYVERSKLEIGERAA
ncbi:MAG: trimethylamine methyltransferase family protein [Proteobacteria bacterium]|nr:trimethylamine methyltransferase family protein [Pseudomonadota bacterium]